MLSLTGGSSNTADFYHVTFTFRRADFYNVIPSIGSQEENPSPQRSGSLVFCIISNFFFLFFFMREKTMLQAPVRRRTATIFGYLVLLRSAAAFVVSLSAASPSPRRSLQHQLQFIAFCWDHLPKLFNLSHSFNA